MPESKQASGEGSPWKSRKVRISTNEKNENGCRKLRRKIKKKCFENISYSEKIIRKIPVPNKAVQGSSHICK